MFSFAEAKIFIGTCIVIIKCDEYFGIWLYCFTFGDNWYRWNGWRWLWHCNIYCIIMRWDMFSFAFRIRFLSTTEAITHCVCMLNLSMIQSLKWSKKRHFLIQIHRTRTITHHTSHKSRGTEMYFLFLCWFMCWIQHRINLRCQCARQMIGCLFCLLMVQSKVILFIWWTHIYDAIKTQNYQFKS